MKNYECRICGCTLDPGEGYLCDECREKTEENKKPHEKYQFSQGSIAGATLEQLHSSTRPAERSNYEISNKCRSYEKNL